MSGSRGPDAAKNPDWDTMYREGRPPWETGLPTAELVTVLDELLEGKTVPRWEVLELGCGTGADAVHLVRRGFDVTAVDSSPTALERARGRVEREDVLARLVLADVFQFAPTAGQFDLIYDAGFYHFIRRVDLTQFLDLLWRVTRPGSYYLTLAGNANETTEEGPPRVSEDEIRGELGRLFDFVHLRPFRFESPDRPDGYLGWSCLMRRPESGA